MKKLIETIKDIITISKFNKNFFKVLKYLKISKSQRKQDLFVLSNLNFKTNGYFVEFGATNGVDLSNTYLLEKKFKWSGILAEPAKCWHKELKKNRKAWIETKCVWKKSHSNLLFNQTNDSEFSTISKFNKSDMHVMKRLVGKKYQVKTISLGDLLMKYKAPKNIDYLSIDTEGSEYEILKNFNFKKFNIYIITCEHNYHPNRKKIYNLLIKNNYKRVCQNISQFDDWYIKKN